MKTSQKHKKTQKNSGKYIRPVVKGRQIEFVSTKYVSEQNVGGLPREKAAENV